MSLRNGFFSRRAIIAGLIGTAGSGLAGCGFSPVYRAKPGGSTVISQQVQTHIYPGKDRLDQVLRNELLFLFGQNQATTLDAASYALSFSAVGLSSGAIVSRVGVSSARIYTLSTTYELSDLSKEEGEVVFSGKTSSQAAYDEFDQQFANLRAERDAEDRTAKDVARMINDQIAAFYASGPA